MDLKVSIIFLIDRMTYIGYILQHLEFIIKTREGVLITCRSIAEVNNKNIPINLIYVLIIPLRKN